MVRLIMSYQHAILCATAVAIVGATAVAIVGAAIFMGEQRDRELEEVKKSWRLTVEYPNADITEQWRNLVEYVELTEGDVDFTPAEYAAYQMILKRYSVVAQDAAKRTKEQALVATLVKSNRAKYIPPYPTKAESDTWSAKELTIRLEAIRLGVMKYENDLWRARPVPDYYNDHLIFNQTLPTLQKYGLAEGYKLIE